MMEEKKLNVGSVMEGKHLFDFYAYLRGVLGKNVLARREGFVVTTCSGVNHLEGVLEELRRTKNFVCVSDVTDGSTFRESGGWFQRRVVEVFFLSRYKVGDREDQMRVMGVVRELVRQVESRIVHDAEYLQGEHDLYLHLDGMPTTELGGIFLVGATGVTLSLAVDEPVSLCYAAEEWEE